MARFRSEEEQESIKEYRKKSGNTATRKTDAAQQGTNSDKAMSGPSSSSSSASSAAPLIGFEQPASNVIATGHADEISALAVSPDGKCLASGGLDGAINSGHSST